MNKVAEKILLLNDNLGLGDHTQLVHGSQIIIVTPVFHELVIGNAKEMHPGRRHPLARGSYAKKLTFMSKVVGSSVSTVSFLCGIVGQFLSLCFPQPFFAGPDRNVCP